MSTVDATPNETSEKAPDGPVLSVTDEAAAKVKELLAQESAEMALRVAVRPGGCSGYSYEMFFDGDISADDVQHETQGVRVVVDPESAPLLKGATLEYKNSLQGGGFSIENPNAKRSCGCGSSFS